MTESSGGRDAVDAERAQPSSGAAAVMRPHTRLAARLGVYRALRWLQLHTTGRTHLAKIRQYVEFYEQILSPGDLVFDIGANRGDMTDAYLRIGARVVAFEPQVEMRELVEARFGHDPNLTVLGCAVGAEEGSAELFVNREHTGSSSLVEGWTGVVSDVRSVPVVTLGSMFERYGVPCYVKIDVEGFELAVLESLPTAVPYVSFEQTRDHQRGVDTTYACIDRIASLGDFEFNFTPAEELRFSFEEWLPGDRFRDVYPSAVSGFEHRYGDVYVRFPAER